MNPSQEQPTNKEFLDGELSDEELKMITAASSDDGGYAEVNVGSIINLKAGLKFK
ncbi:hypothetical protein HW132_01535 [Brasilonema sp. CT11]|nr:hypothetical protein [Brasilonema sp. CT11]